MSTIYAKSSDIKIIPFTLDRTHLFKTVTDQNGDITFEKSDSSNNAYNGRILTEANLAALISALTEYKNIVINYNENNSISFIINGRYFELTANNSDSSPLKASGNQSLWVKASFKGINEYQYLNAADVQKDEYAQFEGLEFSTDLTSGETDGWFQLLENGSVPTKSYYKFTTKSIENINGGTV